MPSRTTPTDIRPVPRTPKAVSIYRIAASPFWQFRYFADGKYVRKSTNETDRAKAEEKARELYSETLLKQKLDVTVHPTTFSAVTTVSLVGNKPRRSWDGSAKEPTKRISTSSKATSCHPCRPKTYRRSQKELWKIISPFLSVRRLSKSTLNKHINVIRKILNFALDDNIIKTVPRLPSIGAEHKARPYFDLEAYKKLKKVDP